MRFTGYAALWNRADRAGDVFRAGALADGATVLLHQHRGGSIGRVEARADATGLRVSGELEDATLANLVRCGALTGLSVGYRPRATRQGAWREIISAELVEVSLVAQPMQPGARVMEIEAVPEVNSVTSKRAVARPADLGRDAD